MADDATPRAAAPSHGTATISGTRALTSSTASLRQLLRSPSA